MPTRPKRLKFCNSSIALDLLAALVRSHQRVPKMDRGTNYKSCGNVTHGETRGPYSTEIYLFSWIKEVGGCVCMCNKSSQDRRALSAGKWHARPRRSCPIYCSHQKGGALCSLKLQRHIFSKPVKKSEPFCICDDHHCMNEERFLKKTKGKERATGSIS